MCSQILHTKHVTLQNRIWKNNIYLLLASLFLYSYIENEQ